jgi:hypothetical protein
VAVLGTLVVSLAVMALWAIPLVSRRPIHLLRCDIAAYEGTEKHIAAVLDKYLHKRTLAEARSLRFGETLSYRYRVMLKREDQIEAMMRELSDIEGVERIIMDTDQEGSGQTE